MELFSDTASIEEIRHGARTGVIIEVTTNPSLAAKDGIGKMERCRIAVEEIADIIEVPISVEVISAEVGGMIIEGRDIATWTPNPWVKLSSTQVGIEVMSVLTSGNIKVNQPL